MALQVKALPVQAWWLGFDPWSSRKNERSSPTKFSSDLLPHSAPPHSANTYDNISNAIFKWYICVMCVLVCVRVHLEARDEFRVSSCITLHLIFWAEVCRWTNITITLPLAPNSQLYRLLSKKSILGCKPKTGINLKILKELETKT